MKRFESTIFQGATIALCALLLSGCGQSAPSSSNVSATSNTQAPLAMPPATGDRPLLPGQSGTEYMPNGLPALQPKGVNVNQLFAEDIRDPIERVKRVENAVMDLRREIDAVMPSIVRLAAVEGDIQNLIEQLETMLHNEPAPAAAPTVPVTATPLSVTETVTQTQTTTTAPKTPAAAPSSGQPAPLTDDDMAEAGSGGPQADTQPPAHNAGSTPAPIPAASPPAQNAVTSGPAVTALRLGAHADKTRLVLDLSGKATYRHDLDNAEKLLIVELPGTNWTAAKTATLNDPLIASYSVQPMEGGNGSRLIIQLKSQSSVIYEKALPPEGGSGHRIVIDLKK